MAASAQNLATAASSMSPCVGGDRRGPDLGDDDHEAPVVFVVEGEAADVHGVAGAGAGAGQGLVDAEGAQAPVGLVERLDVGEVGQGDGPLGLPADDRPARRRRRARCGSPRPPVGARRTPPAPGARPGLAARPRPSARPAARTPSPVTAAIRWPSNADVGLGEVGARPDDQPRAVEQVGLVAAQLVEEDPLLLGRRVRARAATGRAGARAPGPARRGAGTGGRGPARRGALDEAGEVGHHELGVVAQAHHAEVGLEGGEGVVGDLGLGGRDGGDERGLARRSGTRPGPRRRAA